MIAGFKLQTSGNAAALVAGDMESALTGGNTFNIMRILANGALVAGDYLMPGLRNITNPTSYEAEQERENKQQEMYTGRVLAMTAMIRQAQDVAETVRNVLRPKPVPGGRHRHDDPPYSRPADHRDRDNNDAPAGRAPQASHSFKRAAHKETGFVESAVGASNFHAAGDVVESLTSKEVRHMGGNVLRGEFKKAAGDAVEIVAGKDARHAIGSACRATVDTVSSATSTAFNAVAQPVVTRASNAAASVGNALTSAKNTVMGWMP